MRVALQVRGTVQGVGFRPFVYAAACAHALVGWVQNDPTGVSIEVQGAARDVRRFIEALRERPPPAARVEHIDIAPRAHASEREFRIVPSETNAPTAPCVPCAPDLAICAQCAGEIASEHERRFQYPFTNCAHCGPRYSILEALPYDRARTSMRAFELCARCRSEYSDPTDRRFHAQPIACPDCGPALAFVRADGTTLARGHHALLAAALQIRSGAIVAVKGLGGFQLFADATNGPAVARLRERKVRAEKPLAVMFPSLAAVRDVCQVSEQEAALLCSAAAPIVLLARREDASALATAIIAPGNPNLGVLLPYTPLHQLLLAAVSSPVICTSGNRSDEPMALDRTEAQQKLAGVADSFLDHDRPILRPLDDSVARVVRGRTMLLRRARGFAPLPLMAAEPMPSLLAVGAQQKSTLALALEKQIVVSQHLGDLRYFESVQLLERTADDWLRFFDARPEAVVCDLHPEYASTHVAERLCRAWNVPLVVVQHHHAHVAAVVAEHGLHGPVLGLAWDGAGLGSDGTLWGGEALRVERANVQRVARLRPFRLPGGERAQREPRRALLAMLYEIYGDRALALVAPWFERAESQLLCAMIERAAEVPRTSSIGRFFDAVAALLGLRSRASFEGQAAMECEFAAARARASEPYAMPLIGEAPWTADWAPCLESMLQDQSRGVAREVIARRFHETLAALAERIAVRAGIEQVVLSGGCFQNALLTRRVVERLEARGFAVFTPERYPANDSAIALGQVWVAAQQRKEDGRVSRHTG